MSTAQRIVAFLAALVLTFAVGYGIGAAVDPVLDEPDGPPAVDHGRQDPPGGHDQHQEDGS